MANRQTSVATTFLAMLGLGALAVAIVAIALTFTALAAERIADAERDTAAVDLLEHRQAVTALLEAEQAATLLDQINGAESLGSAPLTVQRSTAYEAAVEALATLGDRIDSVGAESQRWTATMATATEPTSIDDPLERLVAYEAIIDIACCAGVVPSEEHHVDELLDLEQTAPLPTAAWDYFYIAVATERDPTLRPSPAVIDFLDQQETAGLLLSEGSLPSEVLRSDLSALASIGVSQEAINTFLASEPVGILDNAARLATGQTVSIVSSDQAYAAADAAYRSLNELFAQGVESTRERLSSEMNTGEQITLVTRVVTPLLLLILVAAAFVVHRFARNRQAAVQREQELMDARNRFMRMVSHELRTPATAISGFAEMLGTDWTALTEAEIAEFLAIINRQSTHLSLMVDDLLTLSHLETGRLRLHLGIVNLKQAAEEAISLVDSRYGIEVQTTIDPSITLLVDPDRLTQIIRNLVENAAKYGKVDVAVSAAVVGRGCEVVVSDKGPGVPPSSVGRIFRFWDRGEKDGSRVRGYGMGLAIARHLARAMVGDLIYRSHDPIGSEFVLSLPLGPSEMTQETDADDATEPGPQRSVVNG